jgi:hypothetical protein
VAPLFAIFAEVPPVFPKVLFILLDVLIVFPEFRAVLGQFILTGAFAEVFSQLTAILPPLAEIFPQVPSILTNVPAVLADILRVLADISLRGRGRARRGCRLLRLADSAAA